MYYAEEKFKSSNGIMKESFEMQPKIYQYAPIQLKTNFELVLNFKSKEDQLLPQDNTYLMKKSCIVSS